MKLFKFLILAFMCLGMTTCAETSHAQTPIKFETIYEFHDKTSNAVVATQWKDFTGVGPKKLDITVYAFAGVDQRGKALSGFNLEVPVKIANELTIQAGPAYIIKQGDKGRVGFYLGFTLK